VFGKNKKAAKGKRSRNFLDRLKPKSTEASGQSVSASDGPGFDPMAVQAAPRTEEDRIDAEFDAFLGDLEKEIIEEMANETAVETAIEHEPVDGSEPSLAQIGDELSVDTTDVAVAIDDASAATEPTCDVEICTDRPSSEKVAVSTPEADVVQPFAENDDLEDCRSEAIELAPTNKWQASLTAKDSIHLLFGPALEAEAPKEPETAEEVVSEIMTIVAPKPELKPIFRSDGKEVNVGRLGRFVHERKQVNGDALDAAYRMQEVSGKPIGQILVANGFLTDKQRVQAILSVEESRISQEQVSRSRIPVAVLDQYSIIISAEHDETIFVASPNPEAIIEPIIAEYYSEKKIEFVSYDPSAMSRFITTMRRSASVEDIRETKETMLDRVVYKALEGNASDIHIEPLADCYAVQFRIDGVTRIIHMGALDEYHTVMAQVKDKATIDLAEKRKSQDGSYQIEYNGKMIDLRVSTVPVQTGEHVTIRVLDSDRVHPNLDTLGITQVAKWRKGFKQRSGLCVIAGATGSGKTTTLNSSLREIDRFGKRIYSIEDPVEYRVPFVSQVSTNLSVGLDFAAAIKAFMRNDPDVIILGEVRDAETARNAIKAADTGHLVLITLHTSSIMSTVSRMKDLGIDPREIRYMLRAILVQHLVPKLCTNCHGVNSDGCRVCEGNRYVGRTVASECEYFESVKDVDRLLEARNGNIPDDERPWVSMAEDAVNQMRQGITDVPGLERTFGSEIYRFLSEEEMKLCSNL
jgi:type II secretory ATPase GspE/PulE/Tfp pilus assembly ATPase PilB-like protein